MPLIYAMEGESPENRVARLNEFEGKLLALQTQVQQQAKDYEGLTLKKYADRKYVLDKQTEALEAKRVDLADRASTIEARESEVTRLVQECAARDQKNLVIQTDHQARGIELAESEQAHRRALSIHRDVVMAHEADVKRQQQTINAMRQLRDDQHLKNLADIQTREHACSKREQETVARSAEIDQLLETAKQHEATLHGELSQQEDRLRAVSDEIAAKSVQADQTLSAARALRSVVDKKEVEFTRIEREQAAKTAWLDQYKENVQHHDVVVKRDERRVRMLCEKHLLTVHPDWPQALVQQEIAKLLPTPEPTEPANA